MALMVMFIPVDAWAGNTSGAVDVKVQAKQLAGQAKNIPKLIAVICYVIGSYFAYRGLMSLQAWIAEPDRNPLPTSLSFLVVSALLISLPHTIALYTNSIGAKSYNLRPEGPEGKQFIEDISPLKTADTDVTFRSTQYHVVKNIYEIPKFIAVLAYVAGAFFAASGLIKLKDWINDADRNPLNPALFRLVTAALLVAFPHILLVATSSFFAYGSGSSASVKVNKMTRIGKMQPFEAIQ